MSESYFQMKDLSVGYHGNVLIHDICTEIKKGEILTLIGPNGSGKSTILKSITKQLTLIGGKVTIGEKNLKDLSYKELATKMAVVLTQRAKPELMTCYEVVAAGRYPYTGRLGILTREDEKKTQEALEIVHATEYAEKSFEAISDGQRQRILTLIGPNGSGKSTILKSITKQLTLIGGKVTIGEKNLKDLSYKELATKMAVVLTQRAKPELMTCYEVVAAGRYPYTGRLGILTREDEKKTQEALEIVHATEYAEKSFEAISDGQRQRILLARAICQEPEVLILDEPTSFLDIRYKLELLTILKNMAKEKQITVIMSLHEIDLAQKISDKILCVKGDTIFGYGEPEAIFKEDFIQKLYEIDNGHFDPVFGSVELAKAEGEAEVFVISSGGSGIPVYRNLQKAKIPFSAGILYTNDIDYHLAEHLAVSVIEEEPFEPVSDRAFERAKQMIRQCKKVINAGIVIGTTNRKMKELLVFAEEMGKLESYEK